MGKKIIKKEGKFYVYVYLDPKKPGRYVYGDYRFLHEPIYVGKGTGKRAYDFRKHNHCFSLKNRFSLIGSDPLILFIKKQLSDQESIIWEILLIATIGRENLGRGPLHNLTVGGDGASGRHNTEETKKKMSEAAKHRPPVSEETKRKISKTKTGGKLSKEHIEKIANSNRGKKRTEEYKQRMSVIRTGEKRSEETKRKIGDSKRGKTLTKEHVRKIVEANIGKTMPEEAKVRIKASMKLLWSLGGRRRKQCEVMQAASKQAVLDRQKGGN